MNLLLKPDEDGLVEGFVADVTERKLAQLRLLQVNEELERRVAERTCELREARDAAEAANLSKDKYLAAASHDCCSRSTLRGCSSRRCASVPCRRVNAIWSSVRTRRWRAPKIC